MPIDNDEWKKVLGVAGASGAFGIVVAIFRGVIQQKHGGWRNFFRGLLAAVVIAVLVGLGLADTAMGIGKKAAIIGACVYVADDILLGFGSLARMFSSDPLRFLREIRASIFHGGKK